MISLSVSERLAMSAAFDLIKDTKMAENPITCLQHTPMRVDFVEHKSAIYMMIFHVPHNSKYVHRVWVKLLATSDHWYKGIAVLESPSPWNAIWTQEFRIDPVPGSLSTTILDEPYKEEVRQVETILYDYM